MHEREKIKMKRRNKKTGMKRNEKETNVKIRNMFFV